MNMQMNIQSVSRNGAPQSVAHQSSYLYGVNKEYLPPRMELHNELVTLEGRGRMDTVYQYRQIEGWLGDVPVSMTYLMAYRSYEYTKQVFMKSDWRKDMTTTNSWVV